MSIYNVPCPKCGGKIISTARMLDDTQAPTNCEAGHTFMRSEALRKQSTKAFYETLRNDLGQGAVVVNAVARLKASSAEDGDLVQPINSYGQGELVNAHLYRVVAERLQEYVKRLKKMGIKQLGSGNFANVFQHPTMPNVAVKLLTHSDRGYESYVKFAEKHADNKYVPKIIQVVEADQAFDKSEYDMGDLRLVFMEKLKPASDSDYDELIQHILNVIGKSGTKTKTEGKTFELVNHPLIWKQIEIQTKDKDLAAVAKFINYTRSADVQIDLHEGNVMMRGTQIVITDPFSSYDW